MRFLVAAALLAAAACVPEEGPLMAPGQDCIDCHGGGGGDDAKAWTVAGTWTRGAHIDVTDANGKRVPMRGNKVGNFYTAESLTPPLQVSVDGQVMDMTELTSGRLMYGGCNLCHLKGAGTRTMENMAPGRDCLRCHNGNVALRFYAAGTFPPAGRQVVIVAQNGTFTATTNAVGNFWIETPLTLPLVSASVDGEQMPPDEGLAPNCGACHGSGGDADD